MRAGLVAQGADTDSDLEGNLSEVRGPSWRKRLPRKELRIRRQLVTRADTAQSIRKKRLKAGARYGYDLCRVPTAQAGGQGREITVPVVQAFSWWGAGSRHQP